MSEAAEKETEYIVGTIDSIVQKGQDKWQVVLRPDGSEYTKNLWTKDSALVTALQEKIGSHGGFVCGVSHWTNKDGKPVRSLWINSTDGEKTETAQDAGPAVPTSGKEAPPSTSTPAYVTDVEKQRLIIRQSSLNRAVEAYEAKLGLNDVDNDLLMGKIMETAGRFERWVYRDTVLEEEPPF